MFYKSHILEIPKVRASYEEVQQAGTEPAQWSDPP